MKPMADVGAKLPIRDVRSLLATGGKPYTTQTVQFSRAGSLWAQSRRCGPI